MRLLALQDSLVKHSKSIRWTWKHSVTYTCLKCINKVLFGGELRWKKDTNNDIFHSQYLYVSSTYVNTHLRSRWTIQRAPKWMSLDCGRKSRLPEKIYVDTGENMQTLEKPLAPRRSEPLFCDVAMVTTPPTTCTTGRQANARGCSSFGRVFCFLAALADCSDAPEHGGGRCSFEAIRFLNTRCSQILHTGPLIHQVANHYINKQYIWSGYKSQFQLFLPPAFFPLDKSNRYFNMYLCGYTPPYSLTHSIKNTQEAEALLNKGWGDDVKVMLQRLTMSNRDIFLHIWVWGRSPGKQKGNKWG